MITEDFYGKKPLVWWVGVVENNNDPLKMGRVQVRIIGLHSEDKSLVPTDKLPWAQVIQPTTGSYTASVLAINDWVFGFFQDGEQAQIPNVLGVFSGIESSTLIPNSSTGFTDPRTSEQKSATERTPSHIVDKKTGEPSLYRNLAREILPGTGVNSTNKKLGHSCDITQYIDLQISKQSFLVKFIQDIRKAVRAFLALLGSDPTGFWSWVTDMFKKIQDELKKIQKYIKLINQIVIRLARILRIMQAILAFVLSLPARFARFLIACLKNVFSQILGGMKSFIAATAPPGLTESFSQLKELQNQVTNTFKEVNNTFNAAVNVLNVDQTYIETPEEKQFFEQLSKVDSIESLESVTSLGATAISNSVKGIAQDFNEGVKSTSLTTQTNPNNEENPLQPTVPY